MKNEKKKRYEESFLVDAKMIINKEKKERTSE